MADYRNSCCGGFPGHAESCSLSPDHDRYLRIRAHEIAKAEKIELRRIMGFLLIEGDLYACQRGCGCVVWDINTHIENVCTDWTPVDA